MSVNAECPRAEEHTPEPTGYLSWHEWAAQMAYRGWTQHRCEGCGLYKIWRGGREMVVIPAAPSTSQQGDGQ